MGERSVGDEARGGRQWQRGMCAQCRLQSGITMYITEWNRCVCYRVIFLSVEQCDVAVCTGNPGEHVYGRESK